MKNRDVALTSFFTVRVVPPVEVDRHHTATTVDQEEAELKPVGHHLLVTKRVREEREERKRRKKTHNVISSFLQRDVEQAGGTQLCENTATTSPGAAFSQQHKYTDTLWSLTH